jgi:transcriptional regulator with XRE-family HTH domain
MQFSDTVRSRVEAKGWSVKRFADEIGRTPEHARKLYTGLAFPSNDLALRIAQKLEIDQEKFQDQLDNDRWEKKHKKKPPESARPDLGPLEGIWERLDADERDCVFCVANCLVKRKQNIRT